MTNKSPIRQKIESILKMDPMIHTESGDIKRFVWVDKRKNSYRMKIYRITASPSEIAEIEKLPHVIKTSYSSDKRFPGITIYFDCAPSKIKL